MKPEKLQQVWQADAARMKVKIDIDRMAEDVQRFDGNFRAAINWRDFREVAVAVVLIPVWLLLGRSLPLPWTWYLTVPALLWVIGFIWVDRRRHPQRPGPSDQPLLYHVRESLGHVEHQIWLLRNVFWWYLLPLSISITAFLLHVAWESTETWWEFSAISFLFLLFLFVLYGFVYRLNQQAVRKQLEPRRRELSMLVASLEGDPQAADSGDVARIASALSDPPWGCNWTQNWNRLIPTWRVAMIMALVTSAGATFGWMLPLGDLGPTWFQASVGAILAFELAFGTAWFRLHRRQNRTSTVSPSAGVRRHSLLPGWPALFVLILILVLSVLAVVGILGFLREARQSGPPEHIRAVSGCQIVGSDRRT